MKTGTIIGIVVVVAIIIVGGFFLFRNQAEAPTATPSPAGEPTAASGNDLGQFIQEAPDTLPPASTTAATPTPDNDGTSEVVAGSTISITETGFSPASLTVSAGTTVTFVNNGQTQHWPASAVHPTHRSYPGSDIQKCGTAEADTIFDSCRGLETGQEYSFTFDETGTWNYHDHLVPTNTGSITVQ